jgi:hypothetical protein
MIPLTPGPPRPGFFHLLEEHTVTQKTNLTRRATLAGLAAIAPAIATPTIPEAADTEPDPIFAAIPASEEATAASEAAWDHVKELGGPPPDYKGCIGQWEDEHTAETTNLEWWRFVEVFETTPTTIEGFVALFEFLALPRWSNQKDLSALAWSPRALQIPSQTKISRSPRRSGPRIWRQACAACWSHDLAPPYPPPHAGERQMSRNILDLAPFSPRKMSGE